MSGTRKGQSSPQTSQPAHPVMVIVIHEARLTEAYPALQRLGLGKQVKVARGLLCR